MYVLRYSIWYVHCRKNCLDMSPPTGHKKKLNTKRREAASCKCHANEYHTCESRTGCILGNGNGRQQVVASDHYDADASSTCSNHSIRHAITFASQKRCAKHTSSWIHFWNHCRADNEQSQSQYNRKYSRYHWISCLAHLLT